MLFTCEQVSAGHPDKIADQISDAIVSDCMKNDLHSRVAVETLIKDNHVGVVGGVAEAVRAAKEAGTGLQLQVEVDRIELPEALHPDRGAAQPVGLAHVSSFNNSG